MVRSGPFGVRKWPESVQKCAVTRTNLRAGRGRMGAGVGKLTERERDELLQDLKRTVDAIDEKVVNLSIEHGEKMDALSDGALLGCYGGAVVGDHHQAARARAEPFS